jgi:CsoR family transcriptional regulator, copper-sensing transcriptional repressor
VKEKHREALTLLKTARGQMDAIIRMTEDERYCVEISNQILAVSSLLRKANLSVLKNHIETCVKDAYRDGTVEEKLEEVIRILNQYIK